MVNCNPTNEGDLWQSHKDDLCRDILYKDRIAQNNTELEFNDVIYSKGLHLINLLLKKQGYCLSDDFPKIPEYELSFSQLLQMETSTLETEELDYNVRELQEEVNENIVKLNIEQKVIYKRIMDSLDQYSNGIFIIYFYLNSLFYT